MPSKHASPNRTRWLVLLALAGAFPVGAAQSGMVCHPLLMEMECRAYRDRLQQSTTLEDRAALESRLAALIRERARFCPLRGSETGKSARPSETSPVSTHKRWL
jgi:hypothetical protein